MSIRSFRFEWDDIPMVLAAGLAIILVLTYTYAIFTFGVRVPPTRAEEALQRKVDSLTLIVNTQDRVIATQRLHFDSCAYISKGQIKKVTNKYWIELRKDGEIW